MIIISEIIIVVKQILTFYIKHYWKQMIAYNEDSPECCICFEIIGNKNNCTTQCGHSFCFMCIAKNLMQYNTCPICRNVLVETEEDIEIDDDDDDEDSEESEDFEDFEEESEETQIQESIMNKEITERFMKHGYNVYDIMSMTTGKYNIHDKNKTNEDIDKMINEINEIISDVERENKELQLFALEDIHQETR